VGISVRDSDRRGYKVVIVGISVPLNITVKRALERALKTNRWVPLQELIEALWGFAIGFPRFAELAHQAILVDNTGPLPVPLRGKNETTEWMDKSVPSRFFYETCETHDATCNPAGEGMSIMEESRSVGSRRHFVSSVMSENGDI
jgi:hypothetical protein